MNVLKDRQKSLEADKQTLNSLVTQLRNDKTDMEASEHDLRQSVEQLQAKVCINFAFMDSYSHLFSLCLITRYFDSWKPCLDKWTIDD